VEENEDWLIDEEVYLTFDGTASQEFAAKVVSMRAIDEEGG
jgi:hypothetical protein